MSSKNNGNSSTPMTEQIFSVNNDFNLLDDIKKLQILEKELYKQLEDLNNKACDDNSPPPTSWIGPQKKRYGDEDCPNIGNHIGTLDTCKKFCKNTPGCTALNFGHNGGCVLRACSKDKVSQPSVVTSDWVSYQVNDNVSDTVSDNNCKKGIVEEQNGILNKINQLTEIRINLFKKIQNTYSNVTTDLKDDKEDLASQIAMVNVVEEQINRIKKNIRTMRGIRNNKLRMIEIGDYEFKRYYEHKKIMRIIFFTCVVIMVASMLLQRNLIPSIIASSIIVLALAICIIMIVRKIVDLSFRSNRDYDKYNYNTIMDVAEMQPDYETVYQHDKKFLGKLIDDTETNLDSLKTSAEHQMSGLTKTAESDFSKVTKAAKKAYKSSGLTKGSSRADVVVDVGKKSKSSVESFSGF